MKGTDRTGFVVFHLAVARLALRHGDLGAARTALQVLRTTDFVGGARVSESRLAVLRDNRSTADEVRDAVTVLVKLRPIGLGGD